MLNETRQTHQIYWKDFRYLERLPLDSSGWEMLYITGSNFQPVNGTNRLLPYQYNCYELRYDAKQKASTRSKQTTPWITALKKTFADGNVLYEIPGEKANPDDPKYAEDIYNILFRIFQDLKENNHY